MGGGECDGKDERKNKEPNAHMIFMYLLQKNNIDVQATTKYVLRQPNSKHFVGI